MSVTSFKCKIKKSSELIYTQEGENKRKSTYSLKEQIQASEDAGKTK